MAKEKKNKQLFSLRLAPQLWAELGLVAKLRGRSMNDLLCEVLQDWWNKQPEKVAVGKLVKKSRATETGTGGGTSST